MTGKCKGAKGVGMQHILKVIIAVGLLCLPHASTAQDNARRIVVTGTGVSTAVPDRAELRLGVEAQGPSAGEAVEDLARALQDVMDALTASGIAQADIQTSTLNLYRGQDSSSLGSLPGGPLFVATSVVAVTTTDLAGIGDLLDDAVSAGANRIEGVAFTVADPASEREAARRMAVADGMAQAELMADAAGVSLGALMILRDAEAGPGGDIGVMRMAVPVAPGQASLSVTVEMVFAIN